MGVRARLAQASQHKALHKGPPLALCMSPAVIILPQRQAGKMLQGEVGHQAMHSASNDL